MTETGPHIFTVACPNCGGSPWCEVEDNNEAPYFDIHTFVECSQCGTRTKGYLPGGPDDKSVEDWNAGRVFPKGMEPK